MGTVGIRVADALDDGEMAGIVQFLEAGEIRVQAEVIVKLENLFLAQANFRARAVVIAASDDAMRDRASSRSGLKYSDIGRAHV